MKRSVIASICIALVSCGDDKNKMDDSPLNEFRDAFSMDELNLIDRIKAAQSESERDELISELERMPVKFHPFHSRWIQMMRLEVLIGAGIKQIKLRLEKNLNITQNVV